MPCAFAGVKTQLVGRAEQRRLRLHRAPCHELVTVQPCVRPLWPGAEECLIPALEVHAIAAGHHQRLGQRGAVAQVRGGTLFAAFQFRQCAHGRRPATLNVPRGKAQQKMRRAVVRRNLIGVEVLVWRIGVG